MNWRPLRLSEALIDPKNVFGAPEKVVTDPRLDRMTKLQILSHWLDRAARTTEREDDGADGENAAMADRVRQAMDHLRRTDSR